MTAIILRIECDEEEARGIESALDACVGSLDSVRHYRFEDNAAAKGAAMDAAEAAIDSAIKAEIIDAARNAYADDDIEIDGDAEVVESGEDGYWVAARVFVRVDRAPRQS